MADSLSTSPTLLSFLANPANEEAWRQFVARYEGFIKERIKVDPGLLLDYLSPFVEPTKVERFRFSREWMRTQFQRINNPKEPTYTIAVKLNLPPSYLLIHRTWLGGIGVLCQLEAEAPFREILTEYLPGFAEPV